MSTGTANTQKLRFALPKGRMEASVLTLLREAGIDVTPTARGYRPAISLPGAEAKLLKSQNIVEMLHLGSRDVGFAGADWVAELSADLVELMDTRLDPVRLVAAASCDLQANKRMLTVASEYEALTRKWIAQQDLNARFIRSYGATEVFPPDDADIIVDNSASGATLEANGLEVVDELMTSSTRLYASRLAMADADKRSRIMALTMLLSSVLEARHRVMVEVNVPSDRLDAVVAVLPCMRKPTVSPLFENEGYAVKVAIPRERLPEVIPAVKEAGATDVVVSALSQIVP